MYLSRRIRGIITLFGATKSLEPEVFFAIDEGVLWRKAAHELTVDHGVSAFVVKIGFFDTNVEGVVVDGTAEGEGYHAPVD